MRRLSHPDPGIHAPEPVGARTTLCGAVHFLQTKRQKPNQLKNKLTIGDDIDFLNNRSKFSESRFVETRKSLSVFQNSDDSYWQLKCNRKTYSKKAEIFNVFKKIFLIPTFYYLLFFVGKLISKWFHDEISEFVKFYNTPWLGFLHGFLLGCLFTLLLSVRIAVIFFVWRVLKALYSFAVTNSMLSTKYSGRIKLIHAKFTVPILIRILWSLVFFLILYFFIRLHFMYAVEFSSNINRLITLVQ